jgi:hypothetical protein
MTHEHSRSLGEKAIAALDEAVAGVVERYRRDGRKLAIWRNGRVVRMSAAQAARLRANNQSDTSR